jgi:hypothetical protein
MNSDKPIVFVVDDDYGCVANRNVGARCSIVAWFLCSPVEAKEASDERDLTGGVVLR